MIHGPDRRIADYISANRGKFTREAITQQLLDAGYEQGAIDATWAVLDTPDPDDVVGEGFWGRFWIYLIGLNVVAFLLVGVATQLIPNAVGIAARARSRFWRSARRSPSASSPSSIRPGWGAERRSRSAGSCRSSSRS